MRDPINVIICLIYQALSVRVDSFRFMRNQNAIGKSRLLFDFVLVPISGEGQSQLF